MILTTPQRYASNPMVVGMDLRNELRRSRGVAPTWNSRDPRSDWYGSSHPCFCFRQWLINSHCSIPR